MSEYKMTVEETKNIQNIVHLHRNHIGCGEVLDLCSTVLALYVENERLKAEVLEVKERCAKCVPSLEIQVQELRTEVKRLSRYEMAWKQINELETPDEVVLLFLAYSLDKIEKECGIEEDK